MAAPRDTWPCGRGFQRWYGFHGGETHQFVPSLFQDNHSRLAAADPEEGYHLSEDLADRAIRYLGEMRSAEPDQPFFLYFATGACHSPHQPPPEWIERYAGRVRRRAGTPGASATFARQQAMGLLPPGTQLSARPAVGAGVGRRSIRDDQRVAARFMECFAGFLSHADDADRPGARLRATSSASGTTPWSIAVSDNGASAEGGARGSINDARLWNGDPAGRRELRERIDELGTPTRAQQLPVGLDDGGQHAVPALEARGPPGRHRRPVHRPLAPAGRRPGRDPLASSPTPSTCCRRSSS